MSARGAVDRLALRLARTDAELIYDSGTRRRAPADTRLDGIARTLGAPVTRRRAVGLIGAGVVAGSLLRPGSARGQNCWPGGPKTCTSGDGRVCVPNDLACCSNDKCAIACPYPWRVCESPANCADTPALCTHPKGSGHGGRTLYCSKRIPVTNGCVDGGTSDSIRGWCCHPVLEKCGSEFNTCECADDYVCGDACCARGQECVSLGMFRGKACLATCRPGWHHDGFDCVCDHGQECGLSCCGRGMECIRNMCRIPPTPPRIPSIFDAFDGFFDTANQSSAAHGGGPRQQLMRVAQGASPVATALLGMAAVNAQGVTAGSAFDETRVDRAYKRRVVAARVSPPRIPAGPGLDATAAQALEKLLAAEAKGFALAIACATALARARGALKKHDMRRARKQVLAAAGFAGKASRALRPVPSLRSRALTALQSTGAAEVLASPEDVAAMQAGVRANGVPADLSGQLRRLGVRGKDLAPVKAALLAAASGGPALIEPLADSARTNNLKAMATSLAKFSRSARRKPIVAKRPRPKRNPG